MSRKIGGVALLLVSALMVLGLVRSDASIAALETFVAVVVGVVLPAVGGVALLRTANAHGRRGGSRAALGRRGAIEAEVLRLAVLRGGRLTAVEVAAALAVPPEEAGAVLDDLVTREVADLDVTDAGGRVYTFHQDAETTRGRPVRGLLDE